MAKAKTKAAVSRKAAKPPARAAKPPKKAAAAKPARASVAKVATSDGAKAAVEKTNKKVAVLSASRKAEPLTLPVTKPVAVPVAKPPPAARKTAETTSLRADLPPPAGFTLLVDGHFKSCFDDLKGAKAAASELKGRFPMLRVEIYDAAKKARLQA